MTRDTTGAVAGMASFGSPAAAPPAGGALVDPSAGTGGATPANNPGTGTATTGTGARTTGTGGALGRAAGTAAGARRAVALALGIDTTRTNPGGANTGTPTAPDR